MLMVIKLKANPPNFYSMSTYAPMKAAFNFLGLHRPWPHCAAVALLYAMVAFAQSPPADSFNPIAGGEVTGLAIQSDGSVLLSGAFLSVGGQSKPYLARVDSEGGLDP